MVGVYNKKNGWHGALRSIGTLFLLKKSLGSMPNANQNFETDPRSMLINPALKIGIENIWSTLIFIGHWTKYRDEEIWGDNKIMWLGWVGGFTEKGEGKICTPQNTINVSLFHHIAFFHFKFFPSSYKCDIPIGKLSITCRNKCYGWMKVHRRTDFLVAFILSCNPNNVRICKSIRNIGRSLGRID